MEVAISRSNIGLSNKSMSEEEESIDEKVPDYLDKAGRSWHFLCHAKEGEEELAQFVQQNGLVPGNENGKRRKFGCSRPECHFRAVFLKANSGIYTRGEHRHEQVDGDDKRSKRDVSIPKRSNERIICWLSERSKIICREKEEIFVGKYGKKFKLVSRFETDEEFEKYRRENWLMKQGSNSEYSDRMYLRCRRYSNHNKLSTNCRNNQQHNHPMGKEKNVNYVDCLGQIWLFLHKINNYVELEKFAKHQMLYIIGNRQKIFYFKCKYAHPTTIKKRSYPPPYCQKRAVFIKTTSSIYVRNEHSHHPPPPFKLRKSKSWSRHGKLYRKLAGFFDVNNAKLNVEQNVPMSKQEEMDLDEEEDGDEEVRIVKHLQRDYKCLGRMKREGEEEQSRTDMECLTVQDEEDDLEEGTSQGTRRRGTFYRYTQRELRQPVIKKEEPEEEEAEPAEDAPLPVLQPHVPANIAWLQQFAVARPAKMLLRERKKRINYGK